MFDFTDANLYNILNKKEGALNMTLGELIKNYMDQHSLTYDTFAQTCQLTKGYISMLVKNVNPKTGKPPVPKIKTYQNIAQGMKMTLDELFDTIDDAPVRLRDNDESSFDGSTVPNIPGMVTMPYTPPRSKIPVIGSVRCGEGGLALEEPLGYEGADVSNPEDYFYLRATGDSMEPHVLEGDYILVHRQPDVESGELAVVIVDGEEGTLKKVIKKNHTIILQPFNANHPTRVFVGEEINSIVIAGKAVGMVRKW